jgi:hypothetical protein
VGAIQPQLGPWKGQQAGRNEVVDLLVGGEFGGLGCLGDLGATLWAFASAPTKPHASETRRRIIRVAGIAPSRYT